MQMSECILVGPSRNQWVDLFKGEHVVYLHSQNTCSSLCCVLVEL